MREIIALIAVPLSNIITYLLGHISAKRKERARVEALELGNYQKVVDFYKNTFNDLTKEISELHEEVIKLRNENNELKKELHKLNEFLKQNK